MILQLQTQSLDPSTVVLVLKGVVGLVGVFVSLQAYRGYRRHDSPTMLFIGVGILFLTAVPVVLSYGVTWLTDVPAGVSVLSIGVSYLVGLGAIDYGLNYA